MPERCELALDCRFLAGDDVDQLRDGMAAAIDLPDVDVAIGPTMSPAATDPGCDLVVRFVAAARGTGLRGDTFIPPWTYDAGAASSRGLPVVLFGPSTDNTAAIDAADAIAADELDRAAATVAHVIGHGTS